MASGPRFVTFLWLGVASVLRQTGEMAELLVRIVISAVSRPVGYWSDVRDQMLETLRTSWSTLIISTFVFGFTTPGLQMGSAYGLLGVPERIGSYFVLASVREFGPWLNAIVIAGVAGARVTADLGTRRIRQEFDAIEVMGGDPVRDVVLPRVVALTLMTGLMSGVALTCGLLAGLAAAVIAGASPAAFALSFWTNASPTSLVASVLKSTIFGLLIGIICAYKGYYAQGGPRGVGRAVNDAVVSAFAAIYVTNVLFSSVLMGTHPELAYPR